MHPTNVLIDTDLGDDVDDILAIAFALLRPELSVKAITTVSYDTAKRCEIVGRLLQVMNRTEVPFAPGMTWPLASLSPARLQKLQDLSSGYILNHYPIVWSPEPLPPAQEDAIGLMAQTVEQYAGDIALVAIGPLTNIAVFLRRYPHLAAKIRHIAIMGGELELNRREHNINWDAAAAEIVFTSGVPLFVGTWNATRKFVLGQEDCQRIKNLDTPLGDLLSTCIELWWPHKAQKTSPVMYDIAPILWSYAPHYYPTQAMPVQIEPGGMTTRGGEGPDVLVAQDMLAEEVRALYMATICQSGSS